MARPAKTKNKRIRKFTVYCSANEFSRIRMYADKSGLTMSEYARGKALCKTILTEEINVKIGQLIRIGNNVNQIAKKLNSGEQVAIEAKTMLYELIDVIDNDR